jgi:hypothetical protein
MADFTKLSELVNKTFTVQKFYGYKWKMWDNTQKKMLVSDVWQKDYRKVYAVETDKGVLDLSANQVGTLLEAIVRNGEANIIGRTYQVKSNGKTGMDIRYFFNVVAEPKIPPVVAQQTAQETFDDYVPDTINLDDIPF